MANKFQLASPILTDLQDINDKSVESQKGHNESISNEPISITNDSKPDNSANYLSDSVNSSKCADDGDSTPDDAEIETNYLEDTPSQHRQPSNALTSSPDEGDDDEEDQKQYTPNINERSNSALYPFTFSDTEEPEPTQPTQTTERRRRNAIIITVDTSSNNTPNRPSRGSTITSNSSYGSTLNSIDTSDTASIPIGCNSISSADTESVGSSAIPPSLNSLDGQSRRNSVLSGIPEQDEEDDDIKQQPMTDAMLDAHNEGTEDWKPEDTDDWKPIWALLLCYYEGKESDTESVDQQSVTQEICRFINDGDDPTQYNPVATTNRAATTNTTSSHSTDTPPSWNRISSDGSTSRSNTVSSRSTDAPESLNSISTNNRSSRGNSVQSVSTIASLNSYGSNDSISRMINNGGRSSRRNSIQSVSTDASLNSYNSNDSIAAVIQNMNMLPLWLQNMNKAPPSLQPINEDQESKANQMNDDVICITGPSRPGTAKSNTSFDFGSRARSSSDDSEDSIGAVVIDNDDQKDDNPNTNDPNSEEDGADDMEIID